jgi:EcsC protein family
MSDQSADAPGADLSTEELADLRWAHAHLEHPSLAARLCSVAGTPIELALQLLPKAWYERVRRAAEASIGKALDVAVDSLGHVPQQGTSDAWHRLSVVWTGAVGGLFGPLTLLAELPATTLVMLRSIADIARSQGENLNTLHGRLACTEVFALGGRTKGDKAADAGYYGLRVTLGLHFSSALLHTGGPAPVANIPGGIELIRGVASRFGVVVSDQVAAKMIPVLGALSGAVLNLVFLQHFQDVARGHFIVRRLERAHGLDAIRVEYERLTREEKEAAARELNPLEGW